MIELLLFMQNNNNDYLNMVDFLRIFLYLELLKFWSFGWGSKFGATECK